MNLIKQIIKESLLLEIGEGTSQPYKWKLKINMPHLVGYAFKTKGGSGLKIEVSFHLVRPYSLNQLLISHRKALKHKVEDVLEHPYYYWDTEFSAVEFKDKPVDDPNITISASEYKTDKIEIYRIMSTLSEIVKDLMKIQKVRGFVFMPATDSRGKLFQRYFENQIPGSEILRMENGATFITVDKSVEYEYDEGNEQYDDIESPLEKTFHRMKNKLKR